MHPPIGPPFVSDLILRLDWLASQPSSVAKQGAQAALSQRQHGANVCIVIRNLATATPSQRNDSEADKQIVANANNAQLRELVRLARERVKRLLKRLEELDRDKSA